MNMLRCFGVVGLLLLMGSCAKPAQAASQRLWSGLGDGVSWSDANNWVGNVAPVASDGVTFSGGVRITNANLGAVALSNVLITSSAGGSSISGAFTINGSLATINIEADANATISAAITITNSSMFVKAGAVNTTLSLQGAIGSTGIFGVRVYGPGAVNMSATSDNTYTGPTVVASNDSNGSAGILQLSSTVSGRVVPGDLQIGGTAGGQPANSAQVVLTIQNCIIDSSNVNVAADGLLNLNAHDETIGTLTGAGNVSLGSTTGGTLTVGDSTTFAFTGAISGAGNFTKSGTGIMTISGTDTYTGATSVASGTLILQSAGTPVVGRLNIGDGVGAASSATLQLNGPAQISAGSQVVVSIDGNFNLNGNSATIAGLTMIGGQVSLGTASTLNVAGPLTLNGGTVSGAATALLSLGGNVQATSSALAGQSALNCSVALNGTRTFTVTPGSTQPELTVNGVVSDGSTIGGIFKNGAGDLDLLTTANTFTGTTTIDTGLMRIKASNVTALQGPIVIGNNNDAPLSARLQDLTFGNDIVPTVPVTVNASGVLDISTGSVSEHIGSLAGTGSVNLGTILLILGGVGNATFDGFISGTGTVVKTGSGSQTFTKNNSYTGMTTINAGTLAINGTQPGNVSVALTGTLGGTGKVGTVTTSGASIVAPGSGAATGALSTGNFTLVPGTTFNAGLGTSAANGFDALNVTGTVTLGGALTVAPASTFTAAIGTRLVIIANDGADPIVGTFSNAGEGAIVSGGQFTFKLTYVGGTGNDVELSVLNVPPLVSSPVFATPPVAGVNQTVTFGVGVADGNNDPLTFAWNFGDGSTGTGAAPTHQYAAAGTYTVSVSISDGNGGTATSSMSITVNAPIVGGGSDSDNDGFSDNFETKFGTNPLDPASLPFPLTGAAATPKPIASAGVSAKLNFAKAGNDSIMVSGLLPVPAGFVPNGAKLALTFGNFVEIFQFDAKGHAKLSKDEQATIALKSKKGVIAAQTSKFVIKLTHAKLQADLAAFGLTNKNASKTAVTLAPLVIFNNGLYSATVLEHYSARQNKSGATSK